MKSAGIIFSGAGAMALMVAYHSIPLLIVHGGIDSLAQLRPFLLVRFVGCGGRRFLSDVARGAIGLAGQGPQRCHTLVFS